MEFSKKARKTCPLRQVFFCSDVCCTTSGLSLRGSHKATQQVADQAAERAMSAALARWWLTRSLDGISMAVAFLRLLQLILGLVGRESTSVTTRCHTGRLFVNDCGFEASATVFYVPVTSEMELVLEMKRRDTGASSTSNQSNNRRNNPKNQKTADAFRLMHSCNLTKATILPSAFRPLPSPSSNKQTGYDNADDRSVL